MTTAACSLLAACSPVAEAQRSSVAATVVEQIPTLLAPPATPDTRLAELQAAASIGLTATAQAGLDAIATRAAVAGAADITATSVVYRAVETQVAATQSSLSATQTQEPISVRETQSAKTQGMIDAAATRVAGEADAFVVRQDAIEQARNREWIITGAYGLVGLIVVVGVWLGVGALVAILDGIKAKERAEGKAIETTANNEAAIAMLRAEADIELQRERELEKARQSARAHERWSRENDAMSENARVAEALDDDDGELAGYPEAARPVVRFLTSAAKVAPDGWRSQTIPTARYWGGNGTRSRGVELLKEYGLVDADRGEGGETRLVGYRSLFELRHALRMRDLELDRPTLETAPLPAEVE